ncbi:hypothetical protein [Staphylococcus equorum]|uniref:hypothetical protein n=1 Tax=Staphylococcus equorum TaxID=246432 RepID=UPI003FD8443E
METYNKKAFDTMANNINAILKKGGSDWFVKGGHGFEIIDKLITGLDTIELKEAHIENKEDMTINEYKFVLFNYTADVFNLDVDRLNNKDKHEITQYVYEYIAMTYKTNRLAHIN